MLRPPVLQRDRSQDGIWKLSVCAGVRSCFSSRCRAAVGCGENGSNRAKIENAIGVDQPFPTPASFRGESHSPREYVMTQMMPILPAAVLLVVTVIALLAHH
jgi:hypothetical protein